MLGMKGQFIFTMAMTATVVAPTAMAAETAGQFGIGVNHAIGEDTSAVSARYWITDDTAIQGTGYYHKDQYRDEEIGLPASLQTYEIGIKGIFAPIVHENSKFLLSLEAGYGQTKQKEHYQSQGMMIMGIGPAEDEQKDNSWFVTPALGAEFMLSGLPELGLNFEVGYRYQDHHGLDTKAQGIVSAVGMIYYF